MDRPKRRYTLTIEIGADTWDDVIDDLRHTSQHIEDHGPSCQSVMGGSCGGHIVTVLQNPEMTHEKYMAELDAYLHHRASAQETPK